MLDDARAVLARTQAMQARARDIRDDLEPELTLAVEATFPMPLLMRSLEALRGAFPTLPATLFTEALGGARETLMTGAARMAIYPIFGGPPAEVHAEFLARDRAGAGRRRRSSARPARPAGAARGSRSACATRADRPQRLRPIAARRRRQPAYLALRRPDGAAGVPAQRLRLVQHAAAHGRGAHRSAAACAGWRSLHGEPPPEFPLYVVMPARPSARARRPLAGRRPARAAEILPDIVSRIPLAAE